MTCLFKLSPVSYQFTSILDNSTSHDSLPVPIHDVLCTIFSEVGSMDVQVGLEECVAHLTFLQETRVCVHSQTYN